MTEHERLLQGAVNLVSMLETMYKTDIRTTADYLHYYEKWESEGKGMPKAKVVRLRASKSVVDGTERTGWNPFVPWDRKKNPIKWSDLL